MNDPIPDDLRAKVSQLPRGIEPARDLWPGIRSEVERVAPSRGNRTPVLRFTLPLAAAATVAIAALLLWPRSEPSSAGWAVASLAGSPRVANKPLSTASQWREGQWLETDANSRARFDVGSIGEVYLEPNSRLRLINTAETDHRLELARGTMSALIWAPPRLFFVETPSATAIDLGCAYTLTVDDSGAGVLHVTSGYVALEHGSRESIIPAGMSCITRPGTGPGTPFAEGASVEFREALDRFDLGTSGTDDALASVLAQSGDADRVTMWHLLARAPATQRGAVFDRLAEFAPPPEGITREGLIDGDRAMRNRWALELGLVSGSF